MRRIVAVAVLALLAGCASEDPGFTGDSRHVSDAVLVLRVEPSNVKLGFETRFTLTVSNAGARPKDLQIPGEGPGEFWVTSGSSEVWRGPFGTAEDTGFVTIPALEMLQFSGSFKPEATGEYLVHAEFHAEGFEGELTAELKVED